LREHPESLMRVRRKMCVECRYEFFSVQELTVAGIRVVKDSALVVLSALSVKLVNYFSNPSNNMFIASLQHLYSNILSLTL